MTDQENKSLKNVITGIPRCLIKSYFSCSSALNSKLLLFFSLSVLFLNKCGSASVKCITIFFSLFIISSTLLNAVFDASGSYPPLEALSI